MSKVLKFLLKLMVHLPVAKNSNLDKRCKITRSCESDKSVSQPTFLKISTLK